MADLNAGSNIASFSLGNWSMIKSGSYNKLLTAYYTSDQGDRNSTEDKVSDFTKQTKVTGNEAIGLISEANKLTNLINKYATEIRVSPNENISSITDDMYDVASKYVKAYNSTLDSAALLKNGRISHNAKMMTEYTKANTDQLKKVGMTVDEKGKLDIDKEQFKKSNVEDLHGLFTDHKSMISRVSRSATYINNLSNALVAAEATGSGSAYTSTGSYASLVSAFSYNSMI